MSKFNELNDKIYFFHGILYVLCAQNMSRIQMTNDNFCIKFLKNFNFSFVDILKIQFNFHQWAQKHSLTFYVCGLNDRCNFFNISIHGSELRIVFISCFDRMVDSKRTLIQPTGRQKRIEHKCFLSYVKYFIFTLHGLINTKLLSKQFS